MLLSLFKIVILLLFFFFNVGYILWNVHFPVVCIINLSVSKVACRYVNMYMLGSFHIAVIGVIKHSGTQVF